MESKKILVYYKQSCGRCDMLRSLINKSDLNNNVEQIDIEKCKLDLPFPNTKIFLSAPLIIYKQDNYQKSINYSRFISFLINRIKKEKEISEEKELGEEKEKK